MNKADSTLTPELLREFLRYDPETGVFTWLKRDRKWFKSDIGYRRWNAIYPGRMAGAVTNQGYRQIAIFQKQYRAARLAWMAVHGRWPTGQIDHINRNRTDERISNLRESTHSQNQKNKGSCSPKSGIKGVHWCGARSKWQVQIRAGGRMHFLGRFDAVEDAAEVAKKFRKDFHGEYACHG